MADTVETETVEDQARAIRDAVLDAALPHVPFDGWSETCIRRAAADAGIDRLDAGYALPRGPADLVEHFVARGDERMMRALEDYDLASMKVRVRIITAVRVRLEQADPDKEAVRRAVAFLALPGHARLAWRTLYRTVDAIWYAAGDTATDFSFYSKRALLAAVYSATLLYWLDDSSEGHADTFGFLDRRVEDVMRLPGLGRRLTRFVPNPLRFFRHLPERS